MSGDRRVVAAWALVMPSGGVRFTGARVECEQAQRNWACDRHDRFDGIIRPLVNLTAAAASDDWREVVARAVDAAAVDHPAWETAHTSRQDFTDEGEGNYAAFVEDITRAVLAALAAHAEATP